MSHLRGQLGLFGFGRFVEGLAERFTLIRYDKPGCGLSDRDSVDLSFYAQVATALAVAEVRDSIVSLVRANQDDDRMNPRVAEMRRHVSMVPGTGCGPVGAARRRSCCAAPYRPV